MGRGSSLNKLERLDQLLGTLKTGDAHTAQSLADDVGVSLRTLMRDLETLRDKGYPIEADKGRGGGVRLYPRWGVGRISLNYREVIDLLLAMNVLEILDSPLLLSNLKSIRNKLYSSFPDSQRPRIRQIRKRILLSEQASNAVMSSYKADNNSQYSDRILESFFEQTCLTMNYQREDGTVSKRTVEIHYLFLNWPVWYLVCFDHLRQASRTFRIDRIQSAKLTGESFKLKNLNDFSPEIEEFSKQL